MTFPLSLSTAKLGDNVLGRVSLSVTTLQAEPLDQRPSAFDIRGSALLSELKSKEESLSVLGVCLCVCNQWACSVDELLIIILIQDFSNV